MRYSEILEKSYADLQKLLKEKKLELFQLRMKKQLNQLQDTSSIRKVRKDIARIKTALKEKDAR